MSVSTSASSKPTAQLQRQDLGEGRRRPPPPPASRASPCLNTLKTNADQVAGGSGGRLVEEQDTGLVLNVILMFKDCVARGVIRRRHQKINLHQQNKFASKKKINKNHK